MKEMLKTRANEEVVDFIGEMTAEKGARARRETEATRGTPLIKDGAAVGNNGGGLVIS